MSVLSSQSGEVGRKGFGKRLWKMKGSAGVLRPEYTGSGLSVCWESLESRARPLDPNFSRFLGRAGSG